jgi:hypothetical protein
MCNSLVNICVFNATGLVSPSEQCIKAIYPFCCFDTNKDRCNNLGYKFDKCTTVDSPKPVSATFSNDATYIKIKFSIEIAINSTITQCTQIFVDADQVLGNSPKWNINPIDKTILEIYPGSNFKLAVGDKLKLRSGVYKSNSNLASTFNDGAEVIITGPPTATMASLNAKVTFPSVVSSCDSAIILDGSASFGGGILSFEWSANAGTFNNKNAAIATLSNFQTTSSLIVGLALSDTLGNKVTKSYTIEIKQGAVPYLELPYDSIDIDPSMNYLVEAKCYKSACATSATQSYTFSWNLVSTTDTAMTAATFSTLNTGGFNRLEINKGKLNANKQYSLQVICTDGAGLQGKGSLTLKTKTPKLVTFIRNGDRLVGQSGDVVVLTSSVTDPSTGGPALPANTTYQWACEDWTSFGMNPLYSSGVQSTYQSDETRAKYSSFTPTSCKTSDGRDPITMVNATSNSISLPSGAMPSESFYYFKLTAKFNSMTGTAYTWLKGAKTTGTTGTTGSSGTTGSTGTTTGSTPFIAQIETSVQYLNATGINSLKANITSASPYQLQWSMTTSGETVDWRSPLDRLNVAFEGRTLKQNVIYIFNVTATSGNEVRYATTSLSLNSAPTSGSFEVSPDNGDLNTNFTISFTGWTDPESNYPLTYKIYLFDQDETKPAVLKIWSTNNVFRNLKFPPGLAREQNKIKGSVEDSLGNLVSTFNQTIKIQKVEQDQAGSSITTMYNSYTTDSTSMSNTEKLNSAINIVKFGAEASDPTVTSVLERVKADIDNLSATVTTESEIEQCFSAYQAYSQSTEVDSTSVTDNVLSLITNYDKFDKALPASVISSVVSIVDSIIQQTNNSTSALGRRLQQEGSTASAVSSIESLNTKTCKSAVKGTSGVEVSSTSSYTTLKCQNQESSDLKSTGASLSILEPNSTSSTSNTIKAPADKFENVTGTIRMDYWVTKGAMTNDTTSNTSHASNELTINFKDEAGNVVDLRGTDSYMNFTMDFVAPEGFVKPEYDVWNSSIPVNKTDNYTLDFKCSYWDETKSAWSTEGINNTMTEVNFTTNTIKCYTQHASKYSTQYQTITRITPEEPEIVHNEEDSSDTWHTFYHMNALYIAVSIVFLWISFAIIGAVIDHFSKKNHLRSFSSASPPVTNRAQTNKLEENSRVFEDAGAFHKEASVSHHSEEVVVSSATDVVVNANKPYHKFLVENYFLTSYICYAKENNSRASRASCFFALLLVQLIICGVSAPEMYFPLAALVAQAVALLAAPLLLMIFSVPKFMSGAIKIVKIVVAVVFGLLIIVGLCGGIGKMSDESSENRMFEWMRAFGVAMLYEVVFGQVFRATIKFMITRMTTDVSFIGRLLRST